MKNNIVHFLPAKAGDCFVIEFDNGECIIIDAGYKSTYYDELKPLLVKLRKKGCKVVLLVITHIDQDHIEGAIELISENGRSSSPQIIEIENIWFNGFFNMVIKNEIFEKNKKNILSSIQKNKMRLVKEDITKQIAITDGNISAKHSKKFEKLCLTYGYQMNSQFSDGVVRRNFENMDSVFKDSKSIGECEVTVLSPNTKMLEKLSKVFNREMIKLFGKDYNISEDEDFWYIFEKLGLLLYEEYDLEENISASESKLEDWVGTAKLAKMNDLNKASIVVRIQYKEYKLLFTGDSDSECWDEFLEEEYDVIKLSHHGTTKPNQKIVEKTRAMHIIISTNGEKYNHPENDLLAAALLKGNKKMYFNYDISQKEMLLNNQKKYGFEVFFNKKEIDLGGDNNGGIYS